MRVRGLVSIMIFAAVGVATPNTLQAYDRYSVNGDATNCRACHGDYLATDYISLTDGMNWGNLHNLHRTTMLSGDCSVCHSSGPRFPVLLASSRGGDGLDPISCMGCHGRAADNAAGNPDFGTLGGYGAGLRQHHDNAGIAVCRGCHQDANPASYTPVAEEVLPAYFANPGANHPNIPVSSCNSAGSESLAGAAAGLDNDGDGIYDLADSDCAAGPDAGVIDAGTGIGDAGVIDAGVIDAGVIDAGVIDAAGSPTDGANGTIDAGMSPSDAGDTGADAATTTTDDASALPDSSPVSGADAGAPADSAGGCGCQSDGDGSTSLALGLLLCCALLGRRRRT